MRFYLSSCFVVFCALIGTCFAFPVEAQHRCDDPVVDEAGLFGDQITRVENAAQKLINQGAIVRIRTVRDFGDAGNLDIYEDQIERSCPSWQAPDGGTRNTLIVLFVEVEHRESGLYAGEFWASALGSEWMRIKNKILNPSLRAGDFAGAFINSMEEIARVTAPLAVTPAVEKTAPPPTPATEERMNVDGGVVSHGLKKIALALGMLVVLIFAVVFFLKWRETERAKQKIQDLAREAKTACVNHVASKFRDDASLFGEDLRLMDSAFAKEDVMPLHDAIAKILERWSEAVAKYGSISIESKNNPDRDDLTTEQYEILRKHYADLNEHFAVIQHDFNEIKQQKTALEEAARRAPTYLEKAKETIEKGRLSIEEIASRGFIVASALSRLGESEKVLAEAVTLLSHRRFVGSMGSCASAVSLALDAVQTARKFPERKNALDERLPGIAPRIQGIRERANNIEPVFEDMINMYAEESLSSVIGNGTEAENRLEQAEESLEQATLAASMEKQLWDEAEDHVTNIDAWLSEAEKLLSAIENLKGRLEEAKEKSPLEIHLARLDLEKAKDYLARHKNDVSATLLDTLSAAEAEFIQAIAESQKERPDYPKLIKLALGANHAADGILERAQEEHEALERKRHLDVSTGEEATRSIDAAEEYIDNRSGVGENAKELLKNAKKTLEHRSETDDLDERIAFARKADAYADDALAKAKAHVRARSVQSGGSSSTWGSPMTTRRSSTSSSYTRRSAPTSSPSPRIGGSGSFGRSSRVGGSGKW